MTEPRAEIWESFVSLLRCYAAAASTPGSEYRVIHADGATQVKYEERVLAFCFQPASGDATWQLAGATTEQRGTFHMREDSTLVFADETKALDMAAIDFIEQITKASPVPAGSEDELSSRPARPAGAQSGGTRCFLSGPLIPNQNHHPTKSHSLSSSRSLQS